jgi:hypothetical protein
VPALGIPHGSFTRTVLETLRDTDKPLSVRDIAERLASGKTLDKRQLGMLVARVRNAVPRLSDQLDGELRGRTTYWRVLTDPSSPASIPDQLSDPGAHSGLERT